MNVKVVTIYRVESSGTPPTPPRFYVLNRFQLF